MDHPLLAVAALTNAEREAKSPERTALVVAERQIDDLGGLFATVRSRLQRVAIWVFEADIAIEVQRGQGVDVAEPSAREPAPRSIGSTAPALRISRPAEPTAPQRPAAAPAEPDLEEAPEDPPGPSGNSVTAEELEMLLDLFERDQPPRRDDGGAR